MVKRAERKGYSGLLNYIRRMNQASFKIGRNIQRVHPNKSPL